MIFNEYHTADKATIYKFTNFQHHISVILSAASTHTIKQYPATNPQPTSTVYTDNMTVESFLEPKAVLDSVKRQYIGKISGPEKIYLFEIYRH